MDVITEISGTLNVVICYENPFIEKSGNSVLLYFALGDTVSCNTLFGIPTIEALGTSWNIKKKEVIANETRGPANVFQITGQ
jgi:hypothetical protein